MMRKSLADLRDEMRAVARGERELAPRPVVPASPALTAEAVELLTALASLPETTVAGLAEHLGKARSSVSRGLQRLVGHGLVRLVREGREVRPELIATEIMVDLASGAIRVAHPGKR
jgi:predicted transcriptional regulator